MKKSVSLAKTFVLALVALAACTGVSCGKAKQKPLQIGFEKGGLCPAPTHIAIAKGLFQEEFDKIGQKFVLVDMTNAGAQADLIAAGKLDAAFNLSSTLLQPIDNGLPIAFVTGVHTGCTKYYARSDSDIYSVEDLRGKKVGVISLSDSSVMNLNRKLDDLGIKVLGAEAEVELLVYSSEDLPIALDKGAVDAIALHDPTSVIAEEKYGLRKILDTATDVKYVHEYCCQAFVTRKVAKENPEAARAYAIAMQKASAYVKEEPRATAQIQLDNNYVSGDIDFNTRLLESYDFTPSVSLGKQSFTAAAVQLQKFGAIKATTNLDEFLKESYPEIPGVPDSFIYNKETGTWTEVWEPIVR